MKKKIHVSSVCFSLTESFNNIPIETEAGTSVQTLRLADPQLRRGQTLNGSSLQLSKHAKGKFGQEAMNAHALLKTKENSSGCGVEVQGSQSIEDKLTGNFGTV